MATGEAERVARALDAKRYGGGWLAFCPAHRNDRTPALSISEGRDGRLLVHCFAGCDARDVLRALADRGLVDGRGPRDAAAAPDPAALEARRREAEREAEARRIRAYRLWRNAAPAEGSIVAEYLRAGRRIPIEEIPPALRSERQVRHMNGRTYPAMIALVTTPERRPLGIHRTFLHHNGREKAQAEPVRMMLGPVSAGAVQLDRAGAELALAEGIETALAFMAATGIPTWAALSTSGLARVALPAAPLAAEIVIAADADAPGLEAAEKLARRAESEGRGVRIARPPDGLDFADVIAGAAQAEAAAAPGDTPNPTPKQEGEQA